MARTNRMGIPESISIARDTAYPYRSGRGMFTTAEWSTHFDDFQGLVTSNVPAGWSAAIIDTGATLTTYTAGNDNGGVVRITSDGASEGVSIYRPKAVTLSGKRFFMEARVRTAAVTDSEIAIGLSSVTATTNPEDLYTTATDSFISFGVNDGAATGVLTYDKSNAGPQTDSAVASSAALSNNTWAYLAIAYNGATTAAVGSVQCYINGNLVISNTVASKIPETIILSPFIGARGGDGAIGTIDFDYVRYSVER